jgi:hypothetical protein
MFTACLVPTFATKTNLMQRRIDWLAAGVFLIAQDTSMIKYAESRIRKLL